MLNDDVLCDLFRRDGLVCEMTFGIIALCSIYKVRAMVAVDSVPMMKNRRRLTARKSGG
jgi:hypothetical protein